MIELPALVLGEIYLWLLHYVEFPKDWHYEWATTCSEGIKFLLKNEVFDNYEDIRQTLFKEQYVLLPISTIISLAEGKVVNGGC